MHREMRTPNCEAVQSSSASRAEAGVLLLEVRLALEAKHGIAV